MKVYFTSSVIKELSLNTNTRRKLLGGAVALLIIVPILVIGAYRMRQNYKEHHYIKETIRAGAFRGEQYWITEAHRDDLDRQTMARYQSQKEKYMRIHHLK